MAKRQMSSGRASRFTMPVVFLIVAVVGVFAVLHFTGTYSLFGLSKDDDGLRGAALPVPEGMVMVPVCYRNLGAYQMVQGVDLFNIQTAAWSEVMLPKDRVEQAGILSDRKSILGRVLRSDKPKGRVFLESDFYPVGTRPGLTAGIPPGKRAVRIEASRIKGLHGLARGDLVDLIYAFPVAGNGNSKDLPQVGGVRGAELQMHERLTNPEKQSSVKIAARGAVVVEPVSIRSMPVAASSLTRGTVTRAVPVQEVVLAMDPDEAVALTAALEVDARVFALPRSGRSDDTGESETPELEPRNPFTDSDEKLPGVRVIEIIDGREKKVIAVPGD